MSEDTFDDIPRPVWASSTQFPHHIWDDVKYEATRLGFTVHRITDESVTYPDDSDWDRFSLARNGVSKIFTRPVQGTGPRGQGFTEAVLWMRENSSSSKE